MISGITENSKVSSYCYNENVYFFFFCTDGTKLPGLSDGGAYLSLLMLFMEYSSSKEHIRLKQVITTDYDARN